MPQYSRLSALPDFLRKQEFWKGALNPKNHLSQLARHAEIRTATGTHCWDITAADANLFRREKSEIALLDIAQGLLERGQWTLPTWEMEQYLASLFEVGLDWKFSHQDPIKGGLSLKAIPSRGDAAFAQSLVTGRWACEAQGDFAFDIWAAYSREGEGSDAELVFLEKVLVPTLGHPLLDFLQLERDLVGMGLDPAHFAGQRSDFVLETFRGLRLVMEVDGQQHRDPIQQALDQKRDQALRTEGWTVWRIPTGDLSNVEGLRNNLRTLLKNGKGEPHWGVEQALQKPRDSGLMTCVWGATVSARIQFLLLEALRLGMLPWNERWEIAIREHETLIAPVALKDFRDWFGRLRRLHGHTEVPEIDLASSPDPQTTHLSIEISVCNPHLRTSAVRMPTAWSRPGNRLAKIPSRKYADRLYLTGDPDPDVLESFIQDLFRKTSLREKQYEIIARIMSGRDVIGLLPTGAGKSLTYQLSGLLLGGLTVYVSPLKSLLQDQYERLVEQGIELAQPISSALSMQQKQIAGAVLKTGSLRVLLVAPERFLMESFRTELALYQAQYGDVSQVVIDECHCVSEWGHEFRPAYLSLARIVRDKTSRKSFSAPLVALTGTASTIVLADVRRELGVEQAEAIIRAQRLDREEIEISCLKTRSKEKKKRLNDLVLRLLAEHRDDSEGLLVFCRFAGGLDGAVGVNASLLGIVDASEMRFFCGVSPNWQTYAAIVTKTKSSRLSHQQVLDNTPHWALKPDLSVRDWEDVKADVQRSYISRVPGSFRVLIATSAFGMGIDKPSIRSVIHYMSPQSPEAYYQEIGRAGRDRQKSEAILLFSDEDGDVADQLLSPDKTIEEVRKIYANYSSNNQYSGGDFIRTFYFHSESYSGPEVEQAAMVALLQGIRQRLRDSKAMLFAYQVPGQSVDDRQVPIEEAVTHEKTREYALIRLIHLGVVVDYIKDYNANAFLLELDPRWESIRDDVALLAPFLAEQFRTYVRRYDRRYGVDAERAILAVPDVKQLEQLVASEMVRYVYEQIERKRRQASRSMLEMARKGVTNAAAFRKELLLYLQVSEKFTELLEKLVESDDPFAWRDVLEVVSSPDEFEELHGACARVLESYPTHIGLLFISAATRIDPDVDEMRRSEEDFRAALLAEASTSSIKQAGELGEALAAACDSIDKQLAEAVRFILGAWMLDSGQEQVAVARYLHIGRFRKLWLGRLVDQVRKDLPEVAGL